MHLRPLIAFFVLSAALLTGLTTGAQPLSIPSLHAEESSSGTDVLSAEQAFTLAPPVLSAIKDDEAQTLELSWRIASGYYLYREQVRLTDAQGQPLAVTLPEGQVLTDAFFGTVQVFRNTLSATAALPSQGLQWPLQLQWQGCADIGVCYPPQQIQITPQQLGLPLQQGSHVLDTPTAAENTPPSSSTLSWLHLPTSLLLGPITLPTMAVIVFLALFSSQWWARRQQLRSGQPVESVLFQATVAGLLMARIAYVAQWASQYWQSSPEESAPLASALLRMIDIRDGGWNLWAGLLAALLWTLWRSRSTGVLRKHSVQALAAGALILIAGSAMQTSTGGQNTPLPSQAFVNVAAQSVDLSRHQGQPLVINLWASWCPPCKREMPVLLQAQKDHPNVRFLWINQGEEAATVLRYLQSMPLPPEQVLLDTEQHASQHWKQRGLPSTYFYDADGQLKAMRTGELSRASLTELLQSVLPHDPPQP